MCGKVTAVTRYDGEPVTPKMAAHEVSAAKAMADEVDAGR
jgi:hypothetical protein